MKSFYRNFFEYLVKVASKATYTHKHSAILIRGNKIISSGYNRTLGKMCGQSSYHAEHMAFRYCPKGAFT